MVHEKPCLALFATKNIQRGNEVRYDYGDEEANLWWRKVCLVSVNV
jgi:hypothetical protein